MQHPPVLIPATEVHPLRSRHVDQEYALWIARPLPGFRPDPSPPAVLYVLDANLFFGTAVEVTRLMHRLFGELPPVLVVGIAYPTDDFFLQGELRTRDFTPTVDSGPRPATGREPALPPGQRMGGAARFLRCLREEIAPLVRELHPEARGPAILFGSSLGGLFVSCVLLEAPDTVSGYVAVSPGLWWDQGHVLRELEGRGDAPRTEARVFLGVGEKEEDPALPFLAPFRMVSNVHRLAALLEPRVHDVQVQVFPAETHTSVVTPALTRGLRGLLRR